MMRSRAKVKTAAQTHTSAGLVQALAAGLLVAGAMVLAAVSARAADYGGQGLVAVPGEAGNPCYAVFHRHRHGEGRSLERVGPEDVPVIRHLRYHNGASLNSRVLSVTAGPGAEVALYKGKHYRRYMFTVAPGSLANLPGGVVDSYQIRCVAPPPPAYGPPPGYK